MSRNAVRADEPIIVELLAPELIERLRAIRLVVFDVDGTLTDGSINLGADGEIQSFNIQDGVGHWLLREAGIEAAWVTGRACAANERRARELEVTELRQSIRDKRAAVEEIAAARGLAPAQIACMGDDLQDLPMFNACGVRLSVADAAVEVRVAADWVAPKAGGRGAARQAAELILKAQGRWDELLDRLGLKVVRHG